MLTPLHLKVINFCAEEIHRQRDGPLAVAHYLSAWFEAWTNKKFDEPLTEVLIIRWAMIAKPNRVSGYRRVPLVNDYGETIGVPEFEIPRLMHQLLEARDILLPTEFCHEFLEIHPFVDGNGRTSKIIYNYLLDSLEDPQLPPDYYKEGL